jgi:hypothetical protein
LAELRANHVTYLPHQEAFLVAPANAEPYALVAFPVVDGTLDDHVRLLFCEPAAADNPTGPNPVFFGVDGLNRGYNLDGASTLGENPADALARLRVRIVDGTVQVDTSQVLIEPRTLDLVGHPPDASCESVKGVPYEGEPGFAVPLGVDLPPIAVALPQRATSVSSPVRILGSADVFEATVSIRIVDEQGQVLVDTFTTATCGTGCRGDFDVDVPFSVERKQPGTVQVFEVSAKDGSMINVVEIPVTLMPAEG